MSQKPWQCHLKETLRRGGIVVATLGVTSIAVGAWSVHNVLSQILPPSAVERASKGQQEDLRLSAPHHPQIISKDNNDENMETFWQSSPRHYFFWNNPFSLMKILEEDINLGRHHSAVHRFALHNLSRLNKLSEPDFHEISLRMPRCVAVQLARLDYGDVNASMFRQTLPFFNRPDGSLVEVLVNLFASLTPGGEVACMENVQFLLSQWLFSMEKTYHKAHPGDEEEKVVRWQRPYISAKNETALLLQTLRAIVRFTAEKSVCESLLKAGLLPLLQEAQVLYGEKHPNIITSIAQILGNISIFDEFHDDLYISGWVSIASNWLRNSSSVDLVLNAAKLFYNMDHACRPSLINSSLSQMVYLLHPTFHKVSRRTSKFAGDVVFVHGLLGGVSKTWRQNDKAAYIHDAENSLSSILLGTYWKDYFMPTFMWVWSRILKTTAKVVEQEMNPCKSCPPERRCEPNPNYVRCWPMSWLPEDFPQVRILGVSFPTSVSAWRTVCPSERTISIRDRGEQLLRELVQAGVGRKPVIFVAHSMGGILVKEMIKQALQSDDQSMKALALQTKGVIFLAVPHAGSPLAKMPANIHKVLAPTAEINELAEGSPLLQENQVAFLDFLERNPDVQIASFGEGSDIRFSALGIKLTIVPPKSADPHVGEFFVLDGNHLEVCKPVDRSDAVYQTLTRFIRDLFFLH